MACPEKASSQKKRELRLALSQAQKLKQRAQYVLIVDENGNERRRYTNDEYCVGVLAVLGPVSFGSVVAPEVLWFEIGIGRSGPYRRSYRNGPNGQRTGMDERRRFGFPSPRALANCLVPIEDLLTRHVHTWRSAHKEDTATVVTAYRNRRRLYLRGTRFHVSLKDNDLLAVVVHSELCRQQRPDLDQYNGADPTDTFYFQVKEITKKLVRLLEVYENHYHSDEWFRRTLEKTNKTTNWQLRYAVDWIWQRNFLPHHLYLILRAMHGRPGEEVLYLILRRHKVSLREVARWGKCLRETDVPLFSKKVFVYCPTRDRDPAFGPYAPGRRKRDRNGLVVYDRLTFELIPKEKTRRDTFGIGKRTTYPLSDDHIPF